MIAEINTNALRRNAIVLREKAVRLCAVIKADAYGHGIDVVRYIDDIADLYAVATVDEALQARQLTEKPILLLTGEEYCRYLSKHKAISKVLPTATTASELKRFIKSGVNFSFEVETGMNRTGNDFATLRKLFDLCYYGNLSPQTCYTHFYNFPSSVKPQFERYRHIIDMFDKFPFLCHACATNVMRLPEEYRLDFSRCGIGLYGYGDERLEPILSVYAPIVALRHVRSGECVGYGEVRLDKDMTIATVRAGYADGFLRTNNRRVVEINDSECEVIGQCCMDLTMIDVTNVKANIGDKAYFLNSRITAERVAQSYNTIPYEVLTNVKRTTRRYV